MPLNWTSRPIRCNTQPIHCSTSVHHLLPSQKQSFEKARNATLAGTVGKYFPAQQTSPGTCGHTQGNSPTGVNTVTAHSASPQTFNATSAISITRRNHSNVTCATAVLVSKPTSTAISRSTSTRTFLSASSPGCFPT